MTQTTARLGATSLATIGLAVLLLVTAAIYWPGLDGTLVLDDYVALRPLLEAERGATSWLEAITAGGSGPTGRPVAITSFVLNWLTTGSDVWFLKLTNVVLHLICGGLVFALSRLMLRRPVARFGPAAHWVALWVAAAWLLAPLLVSTVLYVVQRMAQLSAVFVLAGLLSYVIGRNRIEAGIRAGWRWMFAAFAVCWPLATLSKENGALLPLLAFLIELAFFGFQGLGRRRLKIMFAILISVPAALLLGRIGLDPAWLTADYAHREFTLSERVLSQSRALFDYAANALLIPGGSALGIYHDDFQKSAGWWSPATTLPSVLGWLAVAALAWSTRGTRLGVVAFGLVFFLAAHAVESSVFPLELYFEHRNYLPSVGLFFAIAAGVAWQLGSSRGRRMVLVAVAAIPVAYAGLCYQRVLIWQSWESILLASASSHRDSPRTHTGLASVYINRGELERAFDHLDRANDLYGDRHRGAIALHRLSAYCFGDTAVPPGAYRDLERIDALQPEAYFANALDWLAGAVERGQCRRLDIARLTEAIRARWKNRTNAPLLRSWEVHVALARLLARLGRKGDAVVELEAASALRPQNLETQVLALSHRIDLGEVEAARRGLDRLEARALPLNRRQAELVEALRRRLSR